MTCRINQAALANYRAHAEGGRVVVFDTETTGVTNLDEIVQIAAAEYVNGELSRTINLYVNPTCEINPQAEAVGHLIEALGLEGENSHNALDDTLACGTLFFNLMGRLPAADDFVYRLIPVFKRPLN